ncbi:uncharacterized protein IUM83_14725 [Phytophthora cinnamomi]|uniref:uncharacterized protein n=1 Tax=Phytophthora cinnamomi TaxID=4785 RepID=UPI003559A53B|nr:hypothetical protein IUM83_14725 [Phytophthora cinnamomi]
MGVELPADLTRDYDMLQLLEEDDDSSSVVPTAPTPSTKRKMLANSPTDDDRNSLSSLFSSSPVESLNLGEFLLEDELFLRGMMENDDAIDVSILPDLDMMLPLSPAASSWLDALEGSPCRTDGEAESPLLTQGCHGEKVVSPLKLSHCDSSSSGYTEEEVDSEVELLKREEKYLAAQKEFLEFKGKNRPRRKSIRMRRGRDVAEQMQQLLKSQEENQLLNGFVTQQKMYADNFKAMLAFAPVNDVRMSLMTPLESYIRLGRDLNERRKTILALRKEKLDMTHKFIEQKTLGMDCNEPHEFSDMFDKFGKHYCVNFVVSRYDGVSIYQVARGIYNQLTEKDETLNEAIGITAQREV